MATQEAVYSIIGIVIGIVLGFLIGGVGLAASGGARGFSWWAVSGALALVFGLGGNGIGIFLDRRSAKRR